jgi:hypothetical protein
MKTECVFVNSKKAYVNLSSKPILYINYAISHYGQVYVVWIVFYPDNYFLVLHY